MITEIERLVVKLVGDGSDYERMLAKAIDQTRVAGAALTSNLTAPVTALAASSVNSFADFDHAMTESTALIELTGEEIDALRAKALELGGKLPAGPVAAARAYYELFSAGMDARQAMAALEPIMRFAAAGAFDATTAVALATGALSALGLKSKDAAANAQNLTHIMDAMTKGSTLVTGSVEEFGRSLTRDAAAKMKMFGVSLEEGVALLAAYHEQQIRGALGGNTFGRMLTLVTGAATRHADAWKRAGIEIFDAGGQFLGPINAVEQLEKATQGLSDQARIDLLDKLGIKQLTQKAIVPLLGMSKQLREWKAQLNSMGSVVQDVSDRQLAGFSNQLKVTKNQLTVAAIEIGTMLAPALRALNMLVREAIGWWQGLPAGVKGAVFAVAGLAAAVGPLMLALGLLPTLLAAIKTGFVVLAVVLLPLAPAVLAVGLALAAFVAYAGDVQSAWKMARDWGVSAWAAVKRAVQAFVDWAWPVIRALGFLAAAIWERAQAAVRALVEYAAEGFERLKTTVAIAWQALGGGDAISGLRTGVVEAIIAIEFAVRNVGEVARVVWLKMQLDAVRAFEEIRNRAAHFRELGKWLGEAFATVFANVYDTGAAVFNRLFSDLADLGTNFVDYLTGKKDIKSLFAGVGADVVKGLTKGIKDAPELKDRIPGDLEKRLEKEFKESGAALVMSYKEFRDKRLKELEAIKAPNLFDVPAITTAAAESGRQAGKAFAESFRRNGQAVEATLFGSAEAVERLRKYRATLGLDTFGRSTRKGPQFVPVDGGAKAPEQKVGDAKTHDLLKQLIDATNDNAAEFLPLGL